MHFLYQLYFTYTIVDNKLDKLINKLTNKGITTYIMNNVRKLQIYCYKLVHRTWIAVFLLRMSKEKLELWWEAIVWGNWVLNFQTFFLWFSKDPRKLNSRLTAWCYLFLKCFKYGIIHQIKFFSEVHLFRPEILKRIWKIFRLGTHNLKSPLRACAQDFHILEKLSA